MWYADNAENEYNLPLTMTEQFLLRANQLTISQKAASDAIFALFVTIASVPLDFPIDI